MLQISRPCQYHYKGNCSWAHQFPNSQGKHNQVLTLILIAIRARGIRTVGNKQAWTAQQRNAADENDGHRARALCG